MPGGRIIGTTIKAIVETAVVRLQVSFGEETALIYLWEIVPSDALNPPNKKRERLVTFPLSCVPSMFDS